MSFCQYILWKKRWSASSQKFMEPIKFMLLGRYLSVDKTANVGFTSPPNIISVSIILSAIISSSMESSSRSSSMSLLGIFLLILLISFRISFFVFRHSYLGSFFSSLIFYWISSSVAIISGRLLINSSIFLFFSGLGVIATWIILIEAIGESWLIF